MHDGESSLQSVSEAAVRIRIERGFDIETAARSAGIGIESLEAFEDGLEALPLEQLDLLAAAYGVQTSEFFGGRTTPLQNYAGG